MIKNLKIFFVLIFLNTAVSAQVIPLDPEVRTGKLPNGLTYYLRRNVAPKNRAVFYLANKVGSILETDKQQGLAHFMEHMSFNGTTHFPKNQLIDYLQKAGVRFGADINASTGFDQTVYELPLPTDNPEILKNGIQILRDWAQEALLETSEIDKERGVILEEKRLGKGVNERMMQQYLPLLLNGSIYANRIPIGIERILVDFKPEEIRNFYKDWYRPNLQAVMVVGDINVEKIEQLIKAKFSDLKNPLNEKERIKHSIELTGKNQFMALSDPEMTSTVAQIYIKHQGRELKTVSDYKTQILESLFNQMLSKRYQQLSRKVDPDFLQGTAGVSEFVAGLSAYTASVTAKPGHGELEKAFKSIWRETVKARRFGFTPTEFERAKQSYLGQLESVYKERDKTKSDIYIKEYLQHFLNHVAAPGIDYEYKMVRNQLPEISLNDVNHAFQSYITDINRDILVMAPLKDKAELPSETTVNNWLREVENEKLTPYLDDANPLLLLSKIPLAGKIVSENTDAVLNITTLTLNNGLKVVLKPTGFKNDEILFYGDSPGGTSLYSDDDYPSAANASSIISSFGIGNYTTNQLQQFLNGKQLGVQPFITERKQGVQGISTWKDLETALQMVYGYFTEPRKDRTLFDSMKINAKSGLANRENDPTTVFSDTISTVLGNYNVRHTPVSPSKLDQISLDRAYDIYKERFEDASGFTFTFVGSFSTDAIKHLIAQYLGGLPSAKRTFMAKDLRVRIPNGRIEKIVYKGSEEKASVRLVFSGLFDYNMFSNVELSALKETLSIRMIERLREEEGGVYSPSVQSNSTKYPEGMYTLSISFGCSPSNVAKLIASVMDEIDKLKTIGPPQVNIDKFIAEEHRQFELAVGTNDWWINYLNSCLENKNDFSQMNNQAAVIDGLSPKLIKLAAQKYLSGENCIKFILLPESKEIENGVKSK